MDGRNCEQNEEQSAAEEEEEEEKHDDEKLDDDNSKDEYSDEKEDSSSDSSSDSSDSSDSDSDSDSNEEEKEEKDGEEENEKESRLEKETVVRDKRERGKGSKDHEVKEKTRVGEKMDSNSTHDLTCPLDLSQNTSLTSPSPLILRSNESNNSESGDRKWSSPFYEAQSKDTTESTANTVSLNIFLSQ